MLNISLTDDEYRTVVFALWRRLEDCERQAKVEEHAPEYFMDEAAGYRALLRQVLDIADRPEIGPYSSAILSAANL